MVVAQANKSDGSTRLFESSDGIGRGKNLGLGKMSTHSQKMTAVKSVTRQEYEELLVKSAVAAQGAAETNNVAGALAIALEARKNEIELYWKRATYFWTLLAAVFIAAYITRDDNGILSVAFCCIGLFLSWAWFLVNKGSKYWQENWEGHVDLLENHVIGPLHKVVLRRPTEANATFLKALRSPSLFGQLVTQPSSFSVSKINQWVSLFFTLIWLGIFFRSIFRACGFGSHIWLAPWVLPCTIGAFTICACIYMSIGSQTHIGSHQPEAVLRETEIYASLPAKPSSHKETFLEVLKEEIPKFTFQIFFWGIQAIGALLFLKVFGFNLKSEIPHGVQEFIFEKMNIYAYVYEFSCLIVFLGLAYFAKIRYIVELISEEASRIFYLVGGSVGSIMMMVAAIRGEPFRSYVFYCFIALVYIGVGVVVKWRFSLLSEKLLTKK